MVPVQINENILYIVIDYHRSASFIANKSRWIITVNEELECFRVTIDNNWHDTNTGWGIHRENNTNVLFILGVNVFNENLKIAKFVKDQNHNHWHGYPADWRRKTQDRPPVGLLNNWRRIGVIPKHKIAKIRSGKKCNL